MAHVIRVDDEIYKLIVSRMQPLDTVNDVLRRLLGLPLTPTGLKRAKMRKFEEGGN